MGAWNRSTQKWLSLHPDTLPLSLRSSLTSQHLGVGLLEGRAPGREEIG